MVGEVFAMASPTEWNRLSQSVRSQNTIIRFQNQLKKPTCLDLHTINHSTSPLAGAKFAFLLSMSLNFPFFASSPLEDVVSILLYIDVSILFYYHLKTPIHLC